MSILLAYVVSFWIRNNTSIAPAELPLQYALFVSALGGSVWLIALATNGAYSHTVVRSGVLDNAAALKGTGFAFLVMAAFSYVWNAQFSRALILVSFPVGLMFIITGRRILREYMTRRLEKANAFPRAVVVSRVGASTHIADLIDSDVNVPLRVVERMELHRDDHAHSEIIDRIVAAADRNFAHSVVLDSNLDLSGAVIAEISWQLDQRNVELLAAPAFLGSWAGRLIIERHPSLPLVELSEPRLTVRQEVEKRFLDLIIAVPAFIVLLPVMFAIALLVALTSPGPILFRREMNGRDGAPFWILKFRTMAQGSELREREILGAADSVEQGAYSNDPRVTPLGKVLRKLSLDELPQLWNVITGEMSIVGPRPMNDDEISAAPDGGVRRLLAKPGITGLWQISGRKSTSWQSRFELDLRYIDEWTLGLDLAIIARTFGVVLSGKGSY